MFFDFPEIVIIFGVALVVLGPKKLPGTAAQIGRWVGRARAMARQFREQLEQEVSSVESALDTNTPPEPSIRAPASSSTGTPAAPKTQAETPPLVPSNPAAPAHGFEHPAEAVPPQQESLPFTEPYSGSHESFGIAREDFATSLAATGVSTSRGDSASSTSPAAPPAESASPARPDQRAGRQAVAAEEQSVPPAADAAVAEHRDRR
jgi:sec-independent protein translocase protein TatB